MFRSPIWYCREESLNIPVLEDKVVFVFCNFTYCAVIETTIYSDLKPYKLETVPKIIDPAAIKRPQLISFSC